MKLMASHFSLSLKRTAFALICFSQSACMHAQPSPIPPQQPNSAPAIQQSQASSSRANQTSPPLVIDEKQMVDDMMKKIRRFLTEKPQTAEEIMTLFELKEKERRISNFNDVSILAHGNFPLSQTKSGNLNSFLGFDKNRKLYAFNFYLYEKNEPRPKGAPWCFPNMKMIQLLEELRFIPVRRDNRKSTWIDYVRQNSEGAYEDELTINETKERGACFLSFSYSPSAPLNFIQK